MKILCTALLLSITCHVYPTLHLPIQTYSNLKQEAEALVTSRDAFMHMYRQPLHPQATKDEQLNRLARLTQMAEKWKRDKELFNRAVAVSSQIGTIDTKQALEVQLLLYMPQKKPFDIKTILAELASLIQELSITTDSNQTINQ